MIYKDKNYEEERSLYHLINDEVINCTFEGKLDGESPLKECINIKVLNCMVNLRYPFWHDTNLYLSNSSLKENSRAPFWYCKHIYINDVKCTGIKAIRESNDIIVKNSSFDSDEFAWYSSKITLENSSFVSKYFLFNSKKIRINNITLKGKYSFQYVNDVIISNCNFDTKDAFWHASNVVIVNSTLKGEYIGWYSKNITFINCKIIGTQPFCYAKKLKLINCELVDADFAFEYSDVKASINGHILSIKNPLRGVINIQGELDELIIKDYIKLPKAKIFLNNKKIK